MVSNGVSARGPRTGAPVAQDPFSFAQIQLFSYIKDDELYNPQGEISTLITSSVEKARKENTNEDLATRADEKIAQDAEFREVTGALIGRALEKHGGDRYESGKPLAYPKTLDLGAKIAAMSALGDTILRHEQSNENAQAVESAADDVAGAIRGINPDGPKVQKDIWPNIVG